MLIQLSDFDNGDIAINNLGHEAFVHGQKGLKELAKVLNNASLKPGTKDYIEAILEVQSTKRDHENLGNEKATEYKNFSAQMDKIKGKGFFINKYNEDVNSNKKTKN